VTISLNVSQRDMMAAADSLIRDLLGDVRDAVFEETRGLEQDLEKITRMAVKGKLWRAWASDTWPKSGGISKKPRGRIKLNGGKRTVGAMTFFTQEGRITAGGGGYLAIPTDAAGPRGRTRNLTPGEWERRNGKKLRFVYRRGRPSLLVLDDARVTGRKGVARGRLTKRAGPGYGATIVIFVLLPFVAFSPRISTQPLINRRQGMVEKNIQRRISQRN
jgi:hypothetical protein